MSNNQPEMAKYWVFVTFEDGHRINVANADTLSADYAHKCTEYWSHHNNGHGIVIKVSLEDSNNRVITEW